MLNATLTIKNIEPGSREFLPFRSATLRPTRRCGWYRAFRFAVTCARWVTGTGVTSFSLRVEIVCTTREVVTEAMSKRRLCEVMYTYVVRPAPSKCFLIIRSAEYQLKCGSLSPILGRWTDAVIFLAARATFCKQVFNSFVLILESLSVIRHVRFDLYAKALPASAPYSRHYDTEGNMQLHSFID